LAKNPEGLNNHLSQAAAGRCFSPPELGDGARAARATMGHLGPGRIENLKFL